MKSPLPLPETLLAGLSGPDDLRALPRDRLAALAAEIRELIIGTVLTTGGHLGPNLAVVELTIALHRVFCSPRDTLLFDTGHQSYVHKILTGRGHAFATSLRQPGGLSGYPNRAESVHDVIENSHASTALAYADGIAKARALTDCRDRAVVAVVGDGALTGGLAYEALNNIGAAQHRPVIVVLNDNGHSYSPTFGAIAAHLAQLRGTVGRDSRTASWSRPANPTVFEQLGLAYLGPFDGHDVGALETALRQAKSLGRPVVVHAVTVKGKGYGPACADPERMHTASPKPVVPKPGSPTASWTDIFAGELVDLGARRGDVVAITAAMPGPTGLTRFAERYPDRCFDVGIAEQHAVASAAGLAMAGLHPVVALYSTFLNRAFDQLLLDVALHRLPVTFVLDRSGITGPDGPSHHGMWDLTLLGTVPELRVGVPRDAVQLRVMLDEAVAHTAGPTALRFPKASVDAAIAAIDRVGSLDLLYRCGAPQLLLVPIGPIAAECVAAARNLTDSGIGVTVVDPRWPLPVPTELLELAAEYEHVITVEDNIRHGGIGAHLTRALGDAAIDLPVTTMGLPQRFLGHGKRAEILIAAGLSATGITETALRHANHLRR
ncbi:1-deoxy-D-xylulose-5-phosphate synthase [Nocardia sp. NPDC046473]|uniref:1-deoxy-D-xylulose-5-phosphate synthase n=1 Tax=Nocardia sp. NPDC046473 TaxID=3155733 RepID=UPI0033E98FA0